MKISARWLGLGLPGNVNVTDICYHIATIAPCVFDPPSQNTPVRIFDSYRLNAYSREEGERKKEKRNRLNALPAARATDSNAQPGELHDIPRPAAGNTPYPLLVLRYTSWGQIGLAGPGQATMCLGACDVLITNGGDKGK